MNETVYYQCANCKEKFDMDYITAIGGCPNCPDCGSRLYKVKHHLAYKKDNVNHPDHYTTGSIECIDYIEDKLTAEEFRGYIKGNVLKYITREQHKNKDEDIKKAKWYLDRLIESINKEGA